MRAMTKQGRAHLDKLARVAGGRQYVVRALNELRSKQVDPSLGQLLDFIVANRQRWWADEQESHMAGR